MVELIRIASIMRWWWWITCMNYYSCTSLPYFGLVYGLSTYYMIVHYTWVQDGASKSGIQQLDY